MTFGRLATIALAVFALLALTLGVYVGGYLWLGTVSYQSVIKDGYVVTLSSNGDAAVERNYYPHLWARNIFQPGAKVEGWLRGCEVRAVARQES